MLYGQSIGGAVAIDLASRNQQRVRSIRLVHPLTHAVVDIRLSSRKHFYITTRARSVRLANS